MSLNSSDIISVKLSYNPILTAYPRALFMNDHHFRAPCMCKLNNNNDIFNSIVYQEFVDDVLVINAEMQQ